MLNGSLSAGAGVRELARTIAYSGARVKSLQDGVLPCGDQIVEVPRAYPIAQAPTQRPECYPLREEAVAVAPC